MDTPIVVSARLIDNMLLTENFHFSGHCWWTEGHPEPL